jgi:hypothetical protein
MMHLHGYARTLHDVDASYQCLNDFASSIKTDEEPGCVGEDWTVGWDLPLDMLFTDSNMLRVEHLHLAPREAAVTDPGIVILTS